MESLNSILLTRLTRFNLSELAELYKRAGSATAVIEHKRDIREILPEASTHLIQALKDIDSLREWAEQELEYDRLHNIDPICMNDEHYPQRSRSAQMLLSYSIISVMPTSTIDTLSILSVHDTAPPTGKILSVRLSEN